MPAATATRRRATPRRGRIGSRRPAIAPKRSDTLEITAQPSPALDVETITGYWERAFDAAERALHALAKDSMAASDLEQRRSLLVQERRATALLLRRLADVAAVRPIACERTYTVEPDRLGLSDLDAARVSARMVLKP
jgi:hypothetical protein